MLALTLNLPIPKSNPNPSWPSIYPDPGPNNPAPGRRPGVPPPDHNKAQMNAIFQDDFFVADLVDDDLV